MGLSGLGTALSGLRIANEQINVISTNISNATTPGYTRKILPQSTQIVDGKGVGVVGETIVRNVDINLRRDLWTQVSATEYLDVQATYLNRIQQFHGSSAAEISIGSELSRLEDAFAALSDSPEDTFLLAAVIDQALDTADTVNDLADLITTLRNDAQNEIEQTITRINQLLEQIAELNQQVSVNDLGGRTTSYIEDERDEAIKELAGLIDITYFTRGDGVLVVQTNRGEELVSSTANVITFNSTQLSANSYHPDSINGVLLSSQLSNVTSVDLTTLSVGGKLGGLLELRDVTFPKQTAQLDELAHKLALRFEAQGLRLFTDNAGSVPVDTPPDETLNPPTTVEYIGFAAVMEVNDLILADHTLLRSGTDGASVQPGSNEVIARVLDYTFGANEYQEAIGAIDLQQVSGTATTLQDYLGLNSTNRVEGTIDLTAYTSIADMITQGGDAVFGQLGVSETDRLTLTFDDPNLAGGPLTIDIDLRAVAVSGVDAGQDLVDAITGDANWAAIQAAFDATATINSDGRLVIESRGDVTIAAAAAEPLSDTGFAFLGLVPAIYEAEDPYFDVAVGNDEPTRIYIEPADTEVELLAKLQAVPGLAVEDFTASVDGFIRLRPGNDYGTPEFGGGITITGGPFETSGAGVGVGTIPDGLNIVSALFASFDAGPPVQDTSPVSNVAYASDVSATAGTTTAFRNSLLGPEADISTNITGALTLESYAQSIVNEHAQEIIGIQNRAADEESLRELLETQLSNESGVNIDEELSTLIVVQTAYTAAARVVTAIDELFDDLLAAFR